MARGRFGGSTLVGTSPWPLQLLDPTPTVGPHPWLWPSSLTLGWTHSECQDPAASRVCTGPRRHCRQTQGHLGGKLPEECKEGARSPRAHRESDHRAGPAGAQQRQRCRAASCSLLRGLEHPWICSGVGRHCLQCGGIWSECTRVSASSNSP